MVELNAVTISNISIDRKSVETDGKRCRYRDITVDSGASKSVVSPVEWPNVDAKPPKGLSERTTTLGPWRRKDRKFWGEMTVQALSKLYGRWMRTHRSYVISTYKSHE